MSYFQNPRQDMLPYIPQQRGRVMEIGCGAGVFLSSLSGCGETWGVEPSAAAEAAQTRLTKVFHGTFDQAKASLPKGYFDLIICNDVIEHMPDHQAFLSEIGSYLAPGGVLVGSIPNIRFYDTLFQILVEKDWRYADFGILDRTHLAFFTEKSLRRTLEVAGLSVVLLQGINKDYRENWSRRSLMYLRLARLLSVVSLGYLSDMRYLQFAFQATNARSPASPILVSAS